MIWNVMNDISAILFNTLEENKNTYNLGQ